MTQRPWVQTIEPTRALRRRYVDNTQTHAQPWTSTALETLNVCIDTNLNVWQQLTDYWANVAKEGISLYAELQASTLEVAQEGKTYMLQRLRELPEDLKDPVGSSQKHVQLLSASADKVVKLLQGNMQAMLRSGEQYWLTAQQTGNGIRTSYTQLYDKLTSPSTPA